MWCVVRDTVSVTMPSRHSPGMLNPPGPAVSILGSCLSSQRLKMAMTRQQESGDDYECSILPGQKSDHRMPHSRGSSFRRYCLVSLATAVEIWWSKEKMTMINEFYRSWKWSMAGLYYFPVNIEVRGVEVKVCLVVVAVGLVATE